MYPESEPEFTSPRFTPAELRQDKEVTLGPVMLAGLGAGLLVLCCACFLAGYELGNHGASLPGLKGAAMKDAGPSAAGIFAQAKPSAAPATPAPRSAAPPTAVSRVSAPDTTADDSELRTAAPPTAQLRSAVQTKATDAASSSASQAPAANPAVHPALAQMTPQAAAWRVQIAAVEQKDDAAVLVSALRNRGYSVSVHHDLTDNLLHVQVGPFPSRSEAEAARQKLLNDGYNAILQP
jgi:cell division septation protein DedD